jgi:serine/threonine protein kinase
VSLPTDSDLLDAIQSALGSTYTLERELGGGGMARVFLADERNLHRQIVIKVLRPELAAGVSADRFSREVRLAAKLQQANIVPLIATGDAGGLPYYTMPFVAGESLRALLDKTPQLPVAQAIDILVDVARALAYAHERGIVHRDIKPENILLSGGTAVVTDFGIAKALSVSRTEHDHDTLTNVGVSLGTPAYMAPEQAMGEPTVDPRADLYALGIVAYEMLAGERPFTATSPRELIRAHIMDTPASIAGRRSDTPPALARAIEQSLAKAPEDRVANADALLEMLRVARRQSTTSRTADFTPSVIGAAAATTPSGKAVAPPPRGVIAGVLGAAAIIVVGAFAWRSSRA